MDVEISAVARACERLRLRRAAVLALMPQREIVSSIARWASEWQRPDAAFRRAAAELTEPFPFEMTRFSLDGLLDSLSRDALWELIDREHVRDILGPPLIGHVIAGNTPLLSWVSLLRGMLLRSAAFVKLPSGPSAEWGRLFVRSLAEIAPPLADCLHLAQWSGGTPELDGTLCRHVDLLAAYGSEGTLTALRALCPPSVGFLGYGHRVSFGVLLHGASAETAAHGFARDILLYDQGGCLSPQTIFVEGDQTASRAFADLLARALATEVVRYPQATRTPQTAMRVRETRWLARMEPETMVWEDRALRWTVVARPDSSFALSPTHGVISVQPLARLSSLPEALLPVADYLQGCAVAPPAGQEGLAWYDELARLGVSRVCPPGDLQAPPFSWREDGRDVLCSLLLSSGVEDR